MAKVKAKWSPYRPGVAQRVGRGIALLFHDRGTRRGWVVSSTPRPHFTPGKDPVPIVQEAGWAPGPVWTDGKSRPHRDSIPDCPARSQSLYRLSYPANRRTSVSNLFYFGMTVHVSDGLSVHHQEFKTVHTATKQTLLSACWRVPASKQTAVSVWQMPVAVCTVLNSWWWKERPSETCRV